MSKGLCLYAFDVLVSDLNQASPLALNQILSSNNESIEVFPSKAPLFITWDKNDDLRGCIGTFQPQPIEQGVKRFARTAAFDDPRFPKITKSELSSLSCSVTLLDNFKPISNCMGWEIGKHGLKLSFELNNNYYSGTFLPSVAEEQEWDKLTTLYYLLKKADYGKISQSKVEDFYDKGIKEGWMQLESYEGLKYTLYYDEYEEFKGN